MKKIKYLAPLREKIYMNPQISKCTRSRMAFDGVSCEMGEKKILVMFAHNITFTKW
jgi:hypothetical protein